MPVRKLQKQITSTEFVEWCAFLEYMETTHTKEDYYLAQIAREVHCVLMKSSDRSRVKLDHFLIKFKKKEQEIEDEKTLAKKAELSKLAWAIFLGSQQVSSNKQ